jgi:hypothetical protein
MAVQIRLCARVKGALIGAASRLETVDGRTTWDLTFIEKLATTQPFTRTHR